MYYEHTLFRSLNKDIHPQPPYAIRCEFQLNLVIALGQRQILQKCIGENQIFHYDIMLES